MKEQKHNNRPVALILGGSSGLGLASAHHLAKEGFDLVLIYRERRIDEANLNLQISKWKDQSINVLNFNIDAVRKENIQKVVEELKQKNMQVSLLLHSIARGNLKPLASSLQQTAATTEVLQPADFLLTIEAMAISYYTWVRALFDNQLFTKQASLIAFSSEGSIKAWPNYAAVSAAKAALEAISRSIALEFAPFGIRSNIIRAGITDTRALRMIPGNEEITSQNLKRNPFNRLTTPEDIAKIVYLLSKEESEWLNGTTIPADGGESIA